MKKRREREEIGDESKKCVMDSRSVLCRVSNTMVGREIFVEASFTQSTAPQPSSPKITHMLVDNECNNSSTYLECG